VTASLYGKWILVTRPSGQAEPLCKLIEQHHGKALRFPTLEIQAVTIDTKELENVFSGDWLIFTSRNAVDFALQAFDGKMPSLKLAAVGQATAEALLQAGFVVSCSPQHDFSSEGLLAEAMMQQVRGQKITVIRGVGGREQLAKVLQQRGAEVGYLEIYRRCRPENKPDRLVKHLQAGDLAAITITSGEALENLITMLDETSGMALRRIPMVVVSDRIAELARQMGFIKITVSRQINDAAILERLTTLLNGENSGRSN